MAAIILTDHWTHFKVVGPSHCHAFTLGICDNCGAYVEEPNAVSIMEPPALLRAFGLIEWEGPALSELGHDDNTESEVSCDNCRRD